MYTEEETGEDAEHGENEDPPSLMQPVPVALVRALVSLAENQEEKLRLACLETLGEIGASRSTVLGRKLTR